MHIILIFIGLLIVWALYTSFGPMGFVKLVLGLIGGCIALIIAGLIISEIVNPGSVYRPRLLQTQSQ